MSIIRRCHHNWVIKGWRWTEHFMSEDDRLPGSTSTQVTLVCSHCGQIKFKNHPGIYPDPRQSRFPDLETE